MEEFDGVTINQMKEIATISFDGFNMSGATFDVGVDVETQEGEEENTTKLTANMTLELKDTATTIALPQTATDIYWLPSTYVSEGEYSVEGSVWTHYDNDVYIGSDLGVWIEIQVGEYIVRYDCALTPVKYVAGTPFQSITVTIESMYVCKGTIEKPSMMSGESSRDIFSVDIEEGKSYTLTFDGTTVNGISSIETPTEEELKTLDMLN